MEPLAERGDPVHERFRYLGSPMYGAPEVRVSLYSGEEIVEGDGALVSLSHGLRVRLAESYAGDVDDAAEELASSLGYCAQAAVMR